MPYIYKITNQISNKSYIGKTKKTIRERMQNHEKDSHAPKYTHRSLYRDINKYGVENFIIELIEECGEPISSEREIFWIKHYGTYKYGYNDTIGGDGVGKYDRDEIYRAYIKEKDLNKVLEIYQCTSGTLFNILKSHGIHTGFGEPGFKYRSRKINQYDINHNFIKQYESLMDAGMAVKGKRCHHIANVCKGRRKTAHGYIWEYAETETEYKNRKLANIEIKAKRKKVYQYDLEMNLLCVYDSVAEAGRKIGIHPQNIREASKRKNRIVQHKYYLRHE